GGLQVGKTDTPHHRRRRAVRFPRTVHGVGRRTDSLSGLLEVLPAPFDGIANMSRGHGRPSRTQRSKAVAQPWHPVVAVTTIQFAGHESRDRHARTLRLSRLAGYWRNFKYCPTKSQPTLLA